MYKLVYLPLWGLEYNRLATYSNISNHKSLFFSYILGRVVEGEARTQREVVDGRNATTPSPKNHCH